MKRIDNANANDLLCYPPEQMKSYILRLRGIVQRQAESLQRYEAAGYRIGASRQITRQSGLF